MEFQGSPLLSNEISGFDINDEAKNENYSKELNILYNEIREDLRNLDTNDSGKVSANSLLNYLQSKIPAKRNLNVSLFQNLFEDLERDENSDIDLDDFVKKYIQAHEELKLNFDTLKKGFDKERKIKDGLEEKIQTSKNETINKNGISENSCVSTEIGKVTILAEMDDEQQDFFCSVSIDNTEEKKTQTKNINTDLIFKEKFTFPIDSKEKFLSYKIYSNSNPENPLGEIEVPLFMLNVDNEEITPDFGFKNSNKQTIALFKPKIIIVTSFYDMYKKQFDNIERNIESYQSKIAQLSEFLAEISLPYKKQFDECYARTQKHDEERKRQDEFVDNIENMIKGIFNKKELYWDKIFKLIIYFCIFTQLFTSFTKPDFISLVIEIALAIIINTKMTNYLYEYYKIFFFGIIIAICYDLFNFLFVSNIEISSMNSVNATVKLFGFLGFLGKIALLITTIVVKQKLGKTPSIPNFNNNNN
jgi:hypothetical protein